MCVYKEVITSMLLSCSAGRRLRLNAHAVTLSFGCLHPALIMMIIMYFLAPYFSPKINCPEIWYAHTDTHDLIILFSHLYFPEKGFPAIFTLVFHCFCPKKKNVTSSLSFATDIVRDGLGYSCSKLLASS